MGTEIAFITRSVFVDSRSQEPTEYQQYLQNHARYLMPNSNIILGSDFEISRVANEFTIQAHPIIGPGVVLIARILKNKGPLFFGAYAFHAPANLDDYTSGVFLINAWSHLPEMSEFPRQRITSIRPFLAQN